MDGTLKVAIMQPYFLPYIGYWQLMCNVDVFVLYDDIKYTKKGWINRNRFLLNGKPEYFTLPLKNDSDYLDIRQRQISDKFDKEKIKIIRRFYNAYRNAFFFHEGKYLLDEIFNCEEKNLFQFIYNSIEKIRILLCITSCLVLSSTLGIPRQLKGQDRVIAICKALDATDYINLIGGMALYDRNFFSAQKIRLHFQKTCSLQYKQYHYEFVPNLSIIDSIMFLGQEKLKEKLSEIELC